ncbi:MAG: hypothetical protein ACK59A_11805 [Cyanobacteriota bacterium]
MDTRTVYYQRCARYENGLRVRLGMKSTVFCTHFDRHYLPQGLALFSSIQRHAPGARLWVLALDQRCHELLSALDHPALRVMALDEVETPVLREARANRTWSEYCWTLKPFLPQLVGEMDGEADIVIYVDSDCWLSSSVNSLLARFEASGAACMVTPHAFSPKRDATTIAGLFCAQFMPFRQNSDGLKILAWWQARCLDRCSGVHGQGPLGDQGYLDDWPERFGTRVYVLDQPQLTLAPWNIERFWVGAHSKPCLYHFQGFRLFRLGFWLVIRASAGVPLDREALTLLHHAYLLDILTMLRRLPARSLAPRTLPTPLQDPRGALLLLPRLLFLHWVVWLRALPPALRGRP